MRLSVTFDGDLYAVARSLAKAEDCSISAAINRLLRRAIEQPQGVGRAAGGPALSTFPTSRGKRLLTEQEVQAVEDEA